MQFSINFKRSAHPTSRQTDSTDSTFSRKVAPMVSQSLASEEFLISGVSRLYDELCSQLCEIIPALNEKILARSASQLKN